MTKIRAVSSILRLRATNCVFFVNIPRYASSKYAIFATNFDHFTTALDSRLVLSNAGTPPKVGIIGANLYRREHVIIGIPYLFLCVEYLHIREKRGRLRS